MLVYLVTNTVNGRRYIGQTTKSLAWRWWKHRKTPGCRYLYRAIQKYGEDKFIMEELCRADSIKQLNELETYYINRYRTLSPNGYNLTAGGKNCIMSDETKQRMSLTHMGHPHHPHEWTEEEKQKASARMKGNKHLLGKSPSEETRRKISESMKLRRQKDFWSTTKFNPASERRQTYDALRHRAGLK